MSSDNPIYAERSDARTRLEVTGLEVRDFFSIHQEVKSLPRTKRKLPVLNKGMIVLLSATWEAFCEDIASESLSILVSKTSDPRKLPLSLRQRVARDLKQEKHELAVWQIAGSDWREFLKSRSNELQAKRLQRFNSPRTENVDELFDQSVGIPKISACWGTDEIDAFQNAEKLDEFISLRNQIAHGRPDLERITKARVKEFNNLIAILAQLTENRLDDLFEETFGLRMWSM